MAEDRKIIIIIIGRYRDILYQRQNFEQFLFIAYNIDIDTIEKENNYRSALNMFYREFCGFQSYMQHFEQIGRATFRIIEANPDRRNSFYAILEFQS